MKRLDLYKLKQALESLGNIEGVTFAYAIVKNLKLLEKEIEILEEVRKPSEEYLEEFQPKVDELVKKYSKKDEDGNPFVKRVKFDVNKYGGYWHFIFWDVGKKWRQYRFNPDIKFKRGTKDMLDFGNDLKAAATDSMKK